VKAGDSIGSITLLSGMDRQLFRTINRIHHSSELWNGRVIYLSKKKPQTHPQKVQIEHKKQDEPPDLKLANKILASALPPLSSNSQPNSTKSKPFSIIEDYMVEKAPPGKENQNPPSLNENPKEVQKSCPRTPVGKLGEEETKAPETPPRGRMSRFALPPETPAETRKRSATLSASVGGPKSINDLIITKKPVYIVDSKNDVCIKGMLRLTRNDIIFSPSDETNNSMFTKIIKLNALIECVYYRDEESNHLGAGDAFLLLSWRDHKADRSACHIVAAIEAVEQAVFTIQGLLPDKREDGLKKRLNIDVGKKKKKKRVAPPLPPRRKTGAGTPPLLKDVKEVDTGFGVLVEKSGIIDAEQHKKIRAFLPERFRDYNWKCLFRTSIDGTSLRTFYGRAKDNEETVLLVKSADGHAFGGFATEYWKPVPFYYGNGECFVFSLVPGFAGYKATYSNECYMHSSQEFIGMGGDSTGRHALYMNDSLQWGTSETVTTYLNRRLSKTEEFQILEVELWGLTFEE